MTYEEANRYILVNWFDGDDSAKYCTDGNKETMTMKLAVEALEKQIPRKPNKTIDRTWGVEKEVNVCPSCDYYLGSHYFFSVSGKAGKGVIYCENCGQAVEIDNRGE